jgi:hypothetical protein
MANLNVSSPSNFVSLLISAAPTALTTIGSWTNTTTNVLAVPALQDITYTNSNGTFRWVQLDQTSRYVVTTPATNSLNFNIVLDDASFFTTTVGGSNSSKGLLGLSNNKDRVYFQFAWGGGTGHVTTGSGFLANLAPKVTPDQPVWLSPLVIEVDGNFNQAY